VGPVKQRAQKLGVACILYDIDDPDVSKKGDELVKKYGDWTTDYLIPQVFLEFDSGEVRHVFTGYSEDVELTRNGISNLLTSSLLRADKG
jgi:hypothetical protein